MELLFGLILKMVERELTAQAPEVEAYVLNLLKGFGNDLVMFAETKLNMDINMDGVIGSPESQENK